MSSPVGALLVDARPVDHPTARQRGIGRYVTGLLRGLYEIDAPVIALHGDDLEAEVLADAIPGLRLRRWSPQAVAEHVRHGTWYLATQLMLHPIPLDPVPSVVTRARLPVAAVMYDVIPYRYPERYQVEPTARRQAQLRAPLANTVDAMLAISQFSADTAATELGYPVERIATIGAGVESLFVAPSARPLRRPDRVVPASVERYVVSVTGADERKNTEGLLRAWALVDPRLRERRRLVIATAHSPTVLRRWQAWAADAGVIDEVVFTGSITDDEMVAVLQGAELAVMPSTEEGFGLPVLEAAACGVPVICSNVSSLPEVLDERRAEFDPFHPSSIARAIERALSDHGHRDVLRAAGDRAVQRWTWRRVAEDAVAALAELGPRWPQRLTLPNPRIAIAGPFTESSSGLGHDGEGILEALVEEVVRRDAAATVEIFVDGSGTSEPTEVRAGRRPVRAIGRYAKPWDFDHIVAVIGDSPSDSGVADLAVGVPCHVWLRELPLADALLESMIGRARSVIVGSDAEAATVRRLQPTGPPLLVLPDPGAAARGPGRDASEREAAWGFGDVATALLDWLDDVDGLDSSAVHRCGPAVDASR